MRRAARLKLALVAAAVLALATAAISLAATGDITFVAEYVDGQDGVTGLQGPNDVAVSSDSANVYTAASPGGVATFERNKTTGNLTFVNAKPADGAENVTTSPDGRSVYVTRTSSGLAVYKRNRTSGKLKLLQTVRNGHNHVHGMMGCWGVVVSPDGKSVYVTNNQPGEEGVVTFKRDRKTGKLRFLNDRRNGGSGGNHLANAENLAVSPDGESVYVAAQADSALTTFRRNTKTGSLKFINSKVDGAGGVTGLAGAYQPVVSGDSKYVYVAAYGPPGAIATFKRDRQTGKLTFVNSVSDTLGQPIPGPFDAVVSADGKNLYAACYDSGLSSAMVDFKRNLTNGKLTWHSILRDGVGGVTAPGLWRVAISPDDRSLYTADYTGDSTALFKRAK